MTACNPIKPQRLTDRADLLPTLHYDAGRCSSVHDMRQQLRNQSNGLSRTTCAGSAIQPAGVLIVHQILLVQI